MKVAFLNRSPCAYPGGDVLSINETIDALKPLGVEAKYVHGEWGSGDLQPFDLVHVKHVNFSWSKWNFEQVWASGKPYVVQPVFYPRTDLGMSAYLIGEAVTRGTAKAVIPYTWAEWDKMVELMYADEPHTLDPDIRVQCIPNGTSEAFDPLFKKPAAELDVLTVAARSGKGADTVESICRRRGWSFRCATDIPY